jgi:hypothetical protein
VFDILTPGAPVKYRTTSSYTNFFTFSASKIDRAGLHTRYSPERMWGQKLSAGGDSAENDLNLLNKLG